MGILGQGGSLDWAFRNLYCVGLFFPLDRAVLLEVHPQGGWAAGITPDTDLRCLGLVGLRV